MTKFYWIVCFLALFSQHDFAAGNCTDMISEDGKCYHGEEFDDLCNCPAGWTGNLCQHCQGRFLEVNESGCVSDGYYSHLRFIDCSWLIKLNPDLMESNKTLKIVFEEVGVNCRGDTLTVYDGDGEYAPVLATFSGLVRPANLVLARTVIASSGMAFLKFSSASPVSAEGYVLSYKHTSKSYKVTPHEEFTASWSQGNWKMYMWENMTAQGRSSAAMAIIHNVSYVYGGLLFGTNKLHEQMLRFPIESVVDPVRSDFFPKPRFGHTMVSWKEKGTLIVFGGIILESYTITSDVWLFNTSSHEWVQTSPNDENGAPVPELVGHSSHLVTMFDGRDVMVVIFGYHPEWMHSNFVFEYDIVNNTWTQVSTSGAIPYGAYGHASAHDASTNRIYVHGGVKYDNKHEEDFYLYDVEKKSWQLLNPSSNPQYLHAMGFFNDFLLLTPGRTLQASETCDVTRSQTYDIGTGSWNSIGPTVYITDNIFGQSATTAGNQMYIFGGYDGMMRSDLSVYESDGNVSRCDLYSTEMLCSASPYCTWNETCHFNSCPFTEEDCDLFCGSKGSCTDCLSTAVPCCSCMYSMVSGNCVHYGDNSSSPIEFITDFSSCNVNDTQQKYCDSFKICHQCNAADGCAWDRLSGCRTGDDGYECGLTCLSQDSCTNCTEMNGCAWCESTKTCIPSSDDKVFYPYNTCTDWMYQPSDCIDMCSEATSCDDCHTGSKCGWCALDENTGYGKCIGGTASSAVEEPCSAEWFFESCPACQCNGHSTCDPNSSICNQCMDDTTGTLCNICKDGFYGNPVNGGNCSQCECNGHAETCESDGTCFCNVYGMTGDHCERCTIDKDISGNPINSTCFYEIDTGYKYKLPVRTPYYTQMNFNDCPVSKTDLAISFESISVNLDESMKLFSVTMTYYEYGVENETIFDEYHNISSVTIRMKESDFHFGKFPRKCLRFYTTFTAPFTFQVRYVQVFGSIGILLGAFFSVFILLLIIAIIFWKLNSMWMRYQLRRRVEIEMEERAARPFGCIDFNYNTKAEENISVFTEETAFGGWAAVGSVLLWMPYGESNETKDRTLTIGSTLLQSTPNFKDKARQTVSTRQHQTRPSSFGFDNPVLDIQMEEDIHSEQNSAP